MYSRFASCLVAVALCVMSGTPAVARQSLLGAINAQRADGCDGRRGMRTPLRSNRRLDGVARRIAKGEKLRDALPAAGYRALHSTSLHLTESGSNEAVASALARASCAELTNAQVRHIGVERRGSNIWVVLAAPFDTPELESPREVAGRVLALANEARARARRCGNKSFAAAPPLKLVSQLTDAALAHSRDLARHDRLSHEGSDGSTPAARVARENYAWRLVGENVASGPTTAEEVMEGWLDSPGHCENLMNPRFTDMGLAYTVDAKSESGVYWAQVFATPR
jgi:uncharacterized protein YkwD